MNNATRNDLQDWHNFFSLIIAEMILCQLLINEKEIEEVFPPTMQSIKIMEEYLDGIEPEGTGLTDEEFENLMIDFMDHIKENINGINIRSKESFIIMANFFAKLKYIVEISLSNNLPDQNCFNILKYITFSYAKSRELIGYWTAKQEENVKNLGAEAMKKRKINNMKTISEIKEAMKINDPGIFRTNKILRKTFFDKAKEKTDLTSEDRIFRLLRDNLKKEKLKIRR